MWTSVSAGEPCPAFPGAHAMEPSSDAEWKRAALRSEISLPGDKGVLDATRMRRRKLLQQCQIWLCQTKGISLSYSLHEKHCDPEKISQWLVVYGRELFKSGKAYRSRPELRKPLTQAWDLAVSWIAGEPFVGLAV